MAVSQKLAADKRIRGRRESVFEKERQALQLQGQKKTLAEIGQELKVSAARARELCISGARSAGELDSTMALENEIRTGASLEELPATKLIPLLSTRSGLAVQLLTAAPGHYSHFPLPPLSGGSIADLGRFGKEELLAIGGYGIKTYNEIQAVIGRLAQLQDKDAKPEPDYDLDPLDRAMALLRQALLPLDVSISYLLLLRLLYKHDSLTQTEICAALGFTQGGSSHLVKTLGSYETPEGSRGLCLIESVRDQYQRHKTNVSLTARGRELMDNFELTMSGEAGEG